MLNKLQEREASSSFLTLPGKLNRCLQFTRKKDRIDHLKQEFQCGTSY